MRTLFNHTRRPPGRHNQEDKAMNAEFTYTALARLLNAVEEVKQCPDRAADPDWIAHLILSAEASEMLELARMLRHAARGEQQ